MRALLLFIGSMGFCGNGRKVFPFLSFMNVDINQTGEFHLYTKSDKSDQMIIHHLRTLIQPFPHIPKRADVGDAGSVPDDEGVDVPHGEEGVGGEVDLDP